MKKWLTSSLLALLIVSTLVLYLRFQREKRFFSSQTSITQIAQTGPRKEALKTDNLAEILGLAIDAPTSLSKFNCLSASKKLLECPLIKKAKVEVYDSETLYIDYTLHQPYVWISDAENLVMDREKFLFPFFPFFTPKKMTEVYLGLKSLEGVWNQPIESPATDLAFEILDSLQNHVHFVKRIDVSQAMSAHLAKREIVVMIEREGSVHFLRLTPKGYQKQLERYLALTQRVKQEGDLIVDLRLPGLAFVKQR